MKIKIHHIRKYTFTLGFILFFINPSIALAADTVTHVEEIEGTAWAQSTGEEARKSDKGSLFNVGDEVTAELRSNEISLQSTRRMRLQTIDNIVRSQQTSQRINIPHPHML
jgi:hypothetical protein